MVARTKTYRGDLLVTFETDGEEPEQQLASNGERALMLAILLLARRAELRHGDRLTVIAVEEG